MASRDLTIDEQDQLIAEAVERDEPRLRSFIRKRVLDLGDAEDVLGCVLRADVGVPDDEAGRGNDGVAVLGGADRITDLFRRKKAVSLSEPVEDEEGARALEDLLPSADAGPDRCTHAVCCWMLWMKRCMSCRRISARCLWRMS